MGVTAIALLSSRGLFALFEFLERNGYTIAAPKDELYQFTIDIATSVLDKEQIEAWLRAHTVLGS